MGARFDIMKRSAQERMPVDELERQAWSWLRRLNSGDVKAIDAEAFKRWLRTSPAHRSVFAAAKREWALIEPAAGSVLRTNPEAAALHERALNGPNRNRRVFLGAAASAAAVAGVAVLRPPLDLWRPLDEWGADERTATGEQRTFAVAQRIQVMLNTQTSVRRQTVGSETIGIDLLAGEVAVDLMDLGEPFTVLAGVGRSRAEFGRFEVRHLDGRVCVTCVEGGVSIEHPAGRRTLKTGQQAVYDGVAVSGVAGVEAADVSAWRKGELVFRQTPLARVVEEINRYRAGRVLLMNAAARSKPVSGSFAIGVLDVALVQLQRTFELHARSLPAGLLILS